jgi:uncharacterized protein involved in outer membrane biogenesis
MILVVGLGIAAYTALSKIDLEKLRGQVVSMLSSATGLPVEIDGEIKWRFSLKPQIALEKVSIKNAAWAKHADGVQIGRMTATLNLLSVIRGAPAIDKLHIQDLRVYLEQNGQGEYSLQPAAGGKHDSQYPFNTDLGFYSLELSNPKVALITPSKMDIIELSGAKLKYQHSRDNVSYSGYVARRDMVVPFVVSLMPYNSDRRVYPVKVAIATGGDPLIANIALEGTSLIPIDFTASGTISDMNGIARVFDFELPDIQDIRLNVSGGFGKTNIKFHKSTISSGRNDLTFSGNYDWKSNKISANIKSSRLSLLELVPGLYKPDPWVRPKRELNVFHDTPLGKYFPRKMTADITASLGNLIVYRDLAVKNANIGIKLQDDHLAVDASAVFAGGTVRAAAEILNNDGVLSVKAASHGDRISVGDLMAAVREPRTISDLPMTYDFYLQGYGRDLTGLMSTVSGPIYIYSADKGYAHEDMIEYFYGQDLITKLRQGVQNLFVSKNKNDQIKISCAVVNLKIRDGKIESDNGIAMESNAINVLARGMVDLGQEKINSSIVITPSRGIKLSLEGNVINFVEFADNLAEPTIKVNGSALASRAITAVGLGILLTPFTGGLGLLAGAGLGYVYSEMLDNWLADEHPCKTATRSGAPAAKGDPDWLNMPVSELVGTMIKNDK